MAHSNRTVLLNSLFVGVAAAAAVAVIIWMFSGDTPQEQPAEVADDALELDPEVSFGEFEIDVARLGNEWDEERQSTPEPSIGDDEATLIEMFYRVNEQSLGAESPADMAALDQSLVESASQYISRHGPRAYRAVGWHLVDEFHRALDRAAERTHTTNAELWAALEGDTDDARYLRQRLGNFFAVAQQSGLVDEMGQPRFDRALFSALFRYRWLGFARDYANMALQTPYERVVIWRWRIEAAEGIPTATRLAMVDSAESVYRGHMDTNAVRGILHYQAGNLAEARRFFRRAVNNEPDNEQYRRFLRIAENQ